MWHGVQYHTCILICTPFDHYHFGMTLPISLMGKRVPLDLESYPEQGLDGKRCVFRILGDKDLIKVICLKGHLFEIRALIWIQVSESPEFPHGKIRNTLLVLHKMCGMDFRSFFFFFLINKMQINFQLWFLLSKQPHFQATEQIYRTVSTALWLAQLWNTQTEHMPETTMEPAISPSCHQGRSRPQLPLSCCHTFRAVRQPSHSTLLSVTGPIKTTLTWACNELGILPQLLSYLNSGCFEFCNICSVQYLKLNFQEDARQLKLSVTT